MSSRTDISIQTVTVYLGSSGHAPPVFKDAARQLARRIAEQGKKLVYGGMDAGLMGVLARTALQNGAHVTGIIPRKLKDSERILDGLSETVLVEELCDRKKDMFLMADAVLVLPGGFGTADEMLEVLYWAALGYHTKPLVLINIENYWDDMIAYLKTLPDFDPRFLIVADTVDHVFETLTNWAPPPPVKTPRHLPHFEDEITRGTDEPIVIKRASVENTYFILCALGLKQLSKHQRAIGLVNSDGRFDALLSWTERAAAARFITPKCLALLDTDPDEEALRRRLKTQAVISIDLHREKWGDAGD